jgi:phosphopantothenoylcysteine synthetase/decarboxylase
VNHSAPVIYVIACGAPTADGLYDFITRLHDDGWRVCVVTTPMGARFVDTDRLRGLTGYPVRNSYKNPDEPDVLPPADAYVVAPATFNTINKIANGITDTLAAGLICEALGNNRPVIIVPWFNRALARHGAYARSLDLLRQDGAQLVLTPRTQPGAPQPDAHESFPWAPLHELITKVTPGPPATGKAT